MNDAPIQRMLTRLASRDPNAAAELMPLVYEELKQLAAGYLRDERRGHTLQPTALVHEAYLRIVGSEQPWEGRAHFLGMAALAMRRVLVDHARRRSAGKRGGEQERVTLDGELPSQVTRDVQVLELDELLERLTKLDARKGKVVELRFFAGMTNEQIAEVLQVARSTVADDWAVARAWLASELGEAR